MKQVHKWITISECVDLDTGEIIKDSIFKSHYYLVRTLKCEIEFKEVIINREVLNYGYKKYYRTGRVKGQLRLF